MTENEVKKEQIDTGVVVPEKFWKQAKDESRFVFCNPKTGKVMLSAPRGSGNKGPRITEEEIKDRVAFNEDLAEKGKKLRHDIVELSNDAAKAGKKGNAAEVERLAEKIKAKQIELAKLPKRKTFPKRA